MPIDRDALTPPPVPGKPRLRLDQSSVEELNEALRLYRRLLLELLGVLVIIPLLLLGLPRLSTALSPPYGLHVMGMDLTEWGLLALLAGMLGLFWWRGRRIGTALQDSGLMAALVGALPGGVGVIADRAKAMGMAWRGSFGPLRPVRRGS